jgi:enoyl-[acyl-carrier protein] reductase I
VTDFLQLEAKTFVVFGVANRKSVAYYIARTLEEAGATVVYVVRSPERRESLGKLLIDREILVCDVEDQQQIDRVCRDVAERLDE